MQLGMTIPLQKQLKKQVAPYGEYKDLFYCWELHTIRYAGKSSFIAVNANNRFCMVGYGMKVKDWREIEVVFFNGLKEVFDSLSYPQDTMEAYLEKAGDYVITKTHGRRPVAGLNKAVERLNRYPDKVDKQFLFQADVIRYVNTEICHAAGFEGLGYPEKFFRADLERVGIIPPTNRKN